MKKLLGSILNRRPHRREDTREAARYTVDEPVEFRAWPARDGIEKVLGYGRLVDLSEEGVQIRFSGRIKEGQTIRIHSLQPGDSVLQFDPVVRVRWVQGSDDEELVAGGVTCTPSKRRFSEFEAAE